MKKIKTIIFKEWMEIFKNRMVIFTVAFLPLVMTAIPLAILYSTQGASAATGNISQLPPEATRAMCQAGLNGAECFQVFMVSQFMLLFMIIPVAIPGTIAAYSIVGEKTTRSLEPLLATPITTIELLIGKCLSAVIPAVVSTFAAYAIFAVGAYVLVENKSLLSAFFDARWLVAILLVGPLLALLTSTFSLMVSSRVNDPRVAEQISMVIIVPVLGGFFGQIAGLFVLDNKLISVVAVVMLALNALMIYLASQVFQRESILTRWK
jgi:ABC-2 type transport system permease protein